MSSLAVVEKPKTLAEDAKEFAALTQRKRDLQAQLDSLNEDLERREATLLHRFGDEGVDSIRITVGKEKMTLFPARQLWASCLPGMEKPLFRLLRRNHLGDLIKEKVNTQSLSALIREFDKDGKLFDKAGKLRPSAWTRAVKVTEKYKIGARKA